jgi:hypothetical protein
MTSPDHDPMNLIALGLFILVAGAALWGFWS